MKLASWNVNSIRARQERVLAFLERHEPDVLCLQETKVVDDDFPTAVFTDRGWEVALHGQKTYNGVAILSRTPLAEVTRGLPEAGPQCRLIAATVGDLRVIDVYIPNGSAVGSEKFAYKLEWLARFEDWLGAEIRGHDRLLLCGDFNIAPEDRDVYDPEAWRGKVLCHPEERAAFERLLALGTVDAFRLHHEEAGLYSWWDYRAGMFRRNLGLRIDHVLLTEPLVEECQSVEIDREERRGKGASDHAPVLATLGIHA